MFQHYAVEKERMEARMKEMELEARREWAEAKDNQRLTDKDHHLQDAAKQARLEQTRLLDCSILHSLTLTRSAPITS